MEGKTQKAILLDEYGKKPYFKQDYPIPALKEGELLIKVEGSTVNPSDRIFLAGQYFRRPLPTLCGIEGSGTVVEAKGQALKSWVGKRVSFTSQSGSWSQYAISTPLTAFEIDKDVPLSSASSGVVNPLTVIGFVENVKTLKCKGIIHTAAASSLGRMLNKLCQKQKIPLLNIVRREEHAELLKKQGATHVLVTKGEWEKSFKEIVEKQGFDCVYDALGGGPVTDAIISSLKPKSYYHVYGGLEGKPLQISNPFVLFSGAIVTGFNLFGWWAPTSEQVKTRVRSHYSQLLKNQLKTHTYKEIHLKDLDEALQLSVSKASEGKILLKVD